MVCIVHMVVHVCRGDPCMIVTCGHKHLEKMKYVIIGRWKNIISMTYMRATTIAICGYISDCHVDEVIITSIVVVETMVTYHVLD